MKNILSIDYGAKNIGLAIKTDHNPIVPLECVHNNNQLFSKIQAIIKSKNIELVVIGMPYSLSGAIGPQGEIVAEFSQKLAGITNLPFEYIDERFSSKIIDSQLPDSDSLVAYHLLESFIKRSQNDPDKSK